MGSTIRKAFTPAYKAKVALETIKGVETVGQIASRYQVHPTVNLFQHQHYTLIS